MQPKQSPKSTHRFIEIDQMSKVAVLFTGAYRTFDRTYKHILENILKPNDATAFVLCESDIPSQAFEQLLNGRWPGHIGSVESIAKTRTPDFEAILEYLLKTKPAISTEVLRRYGYSQDYIKRSGSILEYYQFMKCYDLMLKYEAAHNIKFDVIIRSRFDLILTQPLNISGFLNAPNYTLAQKYDEDVYIRSLGNEAMAAQLANNKMVQLFEYDRFSPDAPSVGSRRASYTYNVTDTLKKINEGNHIWTFYCNWIWVAKRHVMDLLYPFVYFYGGSLTDKRDCFNSENQFYDFLKLKGCDIFTFFTQKEWDLWTMHEVKKFPTLVADDSLNEAINKSEVISTIIRH